MEHISPNCLEKYENILQQIDNEYKKCQEIRKQVENVHNKIIAAGIALKQTNIQQKLFKIKVKVFGSVFEIHDVLEHDIPNSHFQELLSYKNHKFYVIEVFASQVFQTKMLHQNWVFNVCIKNSKHAVTRSMTLKRNFLQPLCMIVPFSNSLETCVVDTYLTLPSNSFWAILKLQSVVVDISYHFESNKEMNLKATSISSKVLNVLKCYNKNLNKINQLQASATDCLFYCKCSKEQYVKSLLKNCYHRLDSDLYFNLTKCSDGIIEVQLTTADENKATINFNQQEKSIKIVACTQELYNIKKHFIGELKSEDMNISNNFYPQLIVSNSNSTSCANSLLQILNKLQYLLPVSIIVLFFCILKCFVAVDKIIAYFNYLKCLHMYNIHFF